MINYLRKWWDRTSRVISQTPPIGGLEISPNVLRFVFIDGNNVRTASLRLPEGIIKTGEVVDAVKFEEALKVLKNQASLATGKNLIGVVVALPFSHTYLQEFKLPPVAEKNLEGAVDLNMQMISPIPIKEAYYDYDDLGGDNQLEFLGAFAPRQEVDAFVGPIMRSGLAVVAVEFASLSLTRLSLDMNPKEADSSYLLIYAGNGGIDFMTVRTGKLVFDYFVSWQSLGLQREGLSSQILAAALARSVQQVLNFYTGRWGGSLDSIVVMAPGVDRVILPALSQNFSLPVKVFSPVRFPQLDANWFLSTGLALRGLVPRSQDKFISLLGVGTEEEYVNNQIIAFTKFWRTVLISVLGFLIIVMVAANVFLSGRVTASMAEVKDNNPARYTEVQKSVSDLERQADEFNNLLDSVILSEEERYDWTPLLKKLQTIAGANITITRVFYQSASAPIVLSGLADSEQAVLDFKDRMGKESDFNQVTLPLSNVSRVGGRVSFNVSFSLTKPPK